MNVNRSFGGHGPPYRAKREQMKFLSIVAALFIALLIVPLRVSAPDGAIRVQLTPFQQTTLSTEISANISKLPLREGETFRENQQLIEFDCSLLNALSNKAEASAEAARQALKVSKRLAELNSISSLEVDQATAKVKETEAEAEAMRVNVSKCILKAPYNGRIAKLHVDAFQYVTPGKPLMDIIDTSRLEVRLIVPSRWLGWLKPGSRFSIQIEELGRTYQAKVVRLGARIDPVSQSLPLTGEIDGSHSELLPGMSGWANFSRAKR